MSKKIRLDCLLVDKGLFNSREKAKAAIMAGLVYVEGQKSDKPGLQVLPEQAVEVKGNFMPFVSRGGLKLQKALNVFAIDLSDRVVLDIGASTGGFTDCSLQRGARMVYAVDVGYGQLDWSLRNDPRVVVMERTNFRYLDPELISVKPDFVCIDVSFISLKKILPKILDITDKVEGIALIKPQFEAGRENIGKKGVVREPAVHIKVINEIISFARSEGFTMLGLDYSPIRGPEGNIEFLLYFSLGVQVPDGAEFAGGSSAVQTPAAEINVERTVVQAAGQFA